MFVACIKCFWRASICPWAILWGTIGFSDDTHQVQVSIVLKTWPLATCFPPHLFMLKRLHAFSTFTDSDVIIVLFNSGTLCVESHFSLLISDRWEPTWQFLKFWLSSWWSGRRLSGPCAVSMLRAVPARSGGAGVDVKEDGVCHLQKKMDQQHNQSLQDPSGAAQMASINFISTRLFQQACFGRPECDSSCLVVSS